MDKPDRKNPDEIAATLLLAARFIMEHASARIALPPVPARQLFAELARLVDDTVEQLEALSIAVHATLRQSER
jgi:hypothetical protein